MNVKLQATMYMLGKVYIIYLTSRCLAADTVSSHSQQWSTYCKHLYKHGS